MKNKLIFLILFINTTTFYGQINFEKGYLIDNENRKIECLIKNYDWEKNPNEFEYKLTENEDTKIGNLATVKEFGILGISKFIRVNIKIDRSPTDLSQLSGLRNPIWNQEQLFLKVLVQGKASLYSYMEQNFSRFFYSVNDSLIQQLIYKEYLLENSQIATNVSFRQQLLNDVKCTSKTTSTAKQINCNQKELERYFKKYNECKGDSFLVYNNKKERESFNLRVTPGINYLSFAISNDLYNYRSTDFGNEINFRLGLEAEFILPFNKNKWGIAFEPAYQYFKSQKPIASVVDGDVTVNYNSIELAIGVRHYFFLNKNTKIFLDGFINSIPNVDFNSTIKFVTSSSYITTLEIKSKPNFELGCGIDYKRLNVEIRYYTTQDILSKYSEWASNYQKISFIIGYNLMKSRH